MPPSSSASLPLTFARAALVLVVLVAAACRPDRPADRGAATSPPTSDAPADDLGDHETVLVAAGDISCDPATGTNEGRCRMAETADLVAAQDPDVVAPLGDLQYEKATLAGFRSAYQSNWGRFRDITRPAVGNHEFYTPGAAGYFDYWGDRAGPRGKGWYSYDVGSWHVVVLNSTCDVVDCQAGSEQHQWLTADLAGRSRECVLAYFHHPRFSSGYHGATAALADLWTALVEADVEVALAGHDHHYERFGPMDAEGRPAPDGVRSFVVGTGGRSLYPMLGRSAGHATGSSSSFGVLRLDLHERGYEWSFVAAADSDYRDSGSARCSAR
jgi:acid phosphatase type 7